MKNLLLTFVNLFILSQAFCQITFQPGYYINNANKKVNCLIKNYDWKNNPKRIEYKLNENDHSKIAPIDSVKEFNIEETLTFVRATLDIDRTRKEVNRLTEEKNPVFNKETLFLKLLVAGKANLYSYNDGNLVVYFFKSDTTINQLVNKPYLMNQGLAAKNELYKKQLWSALKCDAIEMEEISKLPYEREDLIEFFNKYNQCGKEYIVKKDAKRKNNIHISLRPGLRYASLTIGNTANDVFNTEFENKLTYRLGLDAEFILPYNRNKWAIFIEPTYQTFKSRNQSGSRSINLQSIEVPIGLRHYLFLNKNSKLFLNAACIVDSKINSKIDLSPSVSLESGSRVNFAIGAGFNYKNKLSIEVRQQTYRDILTNYSYFYSRYNATEMILGYTLF